MCAAVTPARSRNGARARGGFTKDARGAGESAAPWIQLPETCQVCFCTDCQKRWLDLWKNPFIAIISRVVMKQFISVASDALRPRPRLRATSLCTQPFIAWMPTQIYNTTHTYLSEYNVVQSLHIVFRGVIATCRVVSTTNVMHRCGCFFIFFPLNLYMKNVLVLI